LRSLGTLRYDVNGVRQPVPFGKYLLLDRISVGGMAEVFKAKSYGVEGFEKIIAIKRILPTMGEDRDFIKMFIDEAKIAGQLAHANICQIFELGRIDGSHFIAMEYIWGKDLLQIQNRVRKVKQQMPVPMACFAIAKVLEGLDYAHRKRDPLGRPLEIVHRDCSPQNVLVSYEGEVKVIDFGIAKATSRNSRTMAGVLKGKFGYMSPEQVRGLPLDRRSDIFALGTMLYECLTGERLFQGETDFSTLEKVRNVDIQNPRSINPNIPEQVERVILKALAKDVDDRYQWCSEMLADLQQYLMSQDVVFTAKTLSTWLKEVFAGEIEKERQLLEQYKRVGRDGLIAGLPSAEAKVNVVESLGEAGVPEGDATMLGSPNFDDLEQAVAAKAAPEITPAPAPAKARPAAQKQHAKNDDDGDFGEEAPTEIFGEIDNPPGASPAPAPAAAAPRATTTQQQQPQSRPPKPPPGRAPTQGQPAQSMAASPSGQTSTPRPASIPPQAMSMPMPMAGPSDRTMAPQMHDPNAYAAAQPSPQQGYQQQPPQYGQPPQNQSYPGYYQQPPPGSHSGPMPVPQGTPNSMPTAQSGPMNAVAPPGANNPGKTMMGGMAAPAAGNYGQQYRVTGQHAAAGYPPSQPYPAQQNPSMQYPAQGYGSGQMPGYGQPGVYQQQQPGVALDQHGQPTHEKKKSSIGRDVAIGVAIAGLVLGGFLAVKFLILDSGSGGSSSSGSGTTSSIATIRLALPTGVSADLFVDDKKVATVSDKQEIPVTAGQRKVKLVGPNGAKCEQELKLAAGKTTPLECPMKAGPVETNSGSGSAAAGSGSGSAAAIDKTVEKPADTKVTETKPADTKATTTEVKPADTKAATTVTTKPADTKTTTTEVKPADTKASTTTTTKPVDTKTTTLAKPADTKTTTTTTTKPADTKTTTTTKPADTKTTTTTKPADTKVVKTDKMPGETADAKGYLSVQSTPSAKIFVDGVDTGMSTPINGKQLSLAPGKHKVTFVIGGDKFTFAVMIKAGATELLKKDLQ
jgi:eukaryotic-like serine/threonine-protein kinase